MTQITDAARTDLHNRVRDVLGEQEGDTLMAHLPPVGWADVATKKDIDSLAVATKKDIDSLAAATKKDIDSLGAATKKDIDSLAAATKKDIDSLAAATKKDLENVRLAMKADMERGFRRQTMWIATLFAAQATAQLGMVLWAVDRLAP